MAGWIIIFIQISGLLGLPSQLQLEYGYEYVDGNDYGEVEEEEVEVEVGTQFIPEFTTKPKIYQVLPGSLVRLECGVTDLGPSTISWQKIDRSEEEGQYMAVGPSIVAPDPRLQVNVSLHGSVLTILQVNTQDQGEYRCQVFSDPPATLSHRLQIKTSPSVEIVDKPGHGAIVVREGSSLHLRCKGDGEPKPLIYWKKRKSSLVGGRRRLRAEHLFYPSVGPEHGGEYVCVGENHVGSGGEDSIRVEIEYLPRVQLAGQVVDTNTGRELQLTCRVKANPVAEVQWTGLDTFSTNHHVTRITRSGDQVLLLPDHILVPELLEAISCQAANHLGIAAAKLTHSENYKNWMEAVGGRRNIDDKGLTESLNHIDHDAHEAESSVLHPSLVDSLDSTDQPYYGGRTQHPMRPNSKANTAKHYPLSENISGGRTHPLRLPGILSSVTSPTIGKNSDPPAVNTNSGVPMRPLKQKNHNTRLGNKHDHGGQPVVVHPRRPFSRPHVQTKEPNTSDDTLVDRAAIVDPDQPDVVATSAKATSRPKIWDITHPLTISFDEDDDFFQRVIEPQSGDNIVPTADVDEVDDQSQVVDESAWSTDPVEESKRRVVQHQDQQSHHHNTDNSYKETSRPSHTARVSGRPSHLARVSGRPQETGAASLPQMNPLSRRIRLLEVLVQKNGDSIRHNEGLSFAILDTVKRMESRMEQLYGTSCHSC